MPKSPQKGSIDTPREQSERILKKIQQMGNIFEFSSGTIAEPGAPEVTDFYFSSKAPNIDLGPKKQSLEVSFSSMDQENDSLLHFLLNKAKS